MAYQTECYRCNGTGRVNWASHVKGGVCFACDGSGIKTYARKPVRKTNYAFGKSDCFPIFWGKFKDDQAAANHCTARGCSIFMTADEYNSRFGSIEEASAWAATTIHWVDAPEQD